MKYLISMIKIDNTDDGIKYSIVGAFSKPNYISCSWSYDDDDVTTLIQSRDKLSAFDQNLFEATCTQEPAPEMSVTR